MRGLDDRTAVKRRKPKLSIDELQLRIDESTSEAEALRGVDRLLKLREVRDWTEKLAYIVDPVPEVDITALEEAFVEFAADYGTRNEIASRCNLAQ